MRRNRTTTGVTVLALTALLAAACGETSPGTAGGTKAGGEPEPVTLQLAATGGFADRAIVHLRRSLAELTDRQVVIAEAGGWNRTGTDADLEQQIVSGVAAGEIDLGWVGTRAFAELGVTSFDALTAPLLVDSYPLQQAILDSDIPDRMLDGLAELDVTGLAIMAGGLRRPSSNAGPLRSADDYAGITFHAWPAAGNATAVAALGASHTGVAPDERDQGLLDGSIQGYENTLLFYADDVRYAPDITGNVALWPATGVLFINPETLSSLTDDQAAWLREGVAGTVAASVELADADAEAVAGICDRGGRLVEASPADLDSLWQAFTPVYDALAQDGRTAGFLAEIEAFKAAVTTEPLTIPDGCAASEDER